MRTGIQFYYYWSVSSGQAAVIVGSGGIVVHGAAEVHVHRIIVGESGIVVGGSAGVRSGVPTIPVGAFGGTHTRIRPLDVLCVCACCRRVYPCTRPQRCCPVCVSNARVIVIELLDDDDLAVALSDDQIVQMVYPV